MFTSIAGFELRYGLRSPVFVVGSALFFLLTFASVTIDTVQIGARGNVNVNSPIALCETMGIMGVFSLFIVASLVSSVVLRDDETRFAPLVRATRVTKFDYLCGRFVGALGVAAVVMFTVPLAIAVGSVMPWLDPEKVGPFVLGHYLFAYAVIGLPTLVILSSILFTFATLTRSMMWTYVGLLALLVLYSVTRVVLSDPAYDALAALTDPFGLSALHRSIRYWTTSDRNTLLPPLDTLTVLSRAIWLGIAGLCFLVGYWRFDRGEGRGIEGSKAVQTASAVVDRPHLPKGGDENVTGGPAAVRPSSAWKQLLALSRFDLAYIFKSPAFFVLVALGGVNALASLFFSMDEQGVEYWPVTRTCVTALSGAFSIMPIILAIFYAGELVWRDQERRMDEITGATSAPDWAFVLPKIVAITLALLSALVVAVLVAIVFQAVNRYTRFEITEYALWFILPNLVGAFQIAALATFVQVIAPHKYLGWAIMLLYIVASVALQTAGFEHHLYDYAGTSPVPLSDMNGEGRFWIGRAWFELYWTAAATILFVFAYGLWRRGGATPLRVRMHRLVRLAHGVPAVLLVVSSLIFVGSGAFIFYNTNILNRYETSEDAERYLANYEKTLLPFESLDQPRIVDIKVSVDLYPQQTRAITHGQYTIENHTGAPLPVVHVRWKRPLKMTELAVEGAHLQTDYGPLNYRIYAFDAPLMPGERRTLRFTSVLEEEGFPNERPMTRLVANGTFLSDDMITPSIGMDRSDLLKSRAKRRKYGLAAELRPAKLEDEKADAHNILRHDSDWITLDITLSTDADQTPIAPGRTVSDEVRQGRRILHTTTDAPVLHIFSVLSARYLEQQDQWNPGDRDPVALAVYYQQGHEYNVQRMLDVLKASLELYSHEYSPFQFHQMRILEFPAYATFAESFANTVPFSESIGFIQQYSEKAALTGEKYDLVTFVTAHEVGHQWWAHQVIGADKQGSEMLAETFAQYSALLVMEKRFGPEMMRQFLKYELDRYLRGRGREAVEELPLIRVEEQDYIYYDKGALVMWWLKDSVGEATVNRALRRLNAKYAFQGAPYPASSEFVRILREEAGPQYDALITDLFERITLYDMKAHNATARRLANGQYQVRFTIDGRKLYADALGKETDAPLDEPFEIGAFTVEPGKQGYSAASVLHVERRSLKSGAQQIELILDAAPRWVGVDPYNKRIDRNSEDNLTEVTLVQ